MKTKQLHKKEDDRDIIELESLLKDAGDRIDETEGDHVLNLELDKDGNPVDEGAKAFDPSQERDEHGRWTSMGGLGGETVQGAAGPGTGQGASDAADREARDKADKELKATLKTEDAADAKTSAGERINQKPVGPAKIAPHENTNNFQMGAHSDYLDSKMMKETKGKDVTDIQTGVFQKYSRIEKEQVAEKMLQFAVASAKEGIVMHDMKVREKDWRSLGEKMRGKWQDKTLEQVSDGIGGRFVVTSQADADKLVMKMPRLLGMKVLEHDDKVDRPTGGYRAHHLLVRTPGGFMAEIQVKTHNQDAWSKWSHDQLYKGPTASQMKKDPEARKYARDVSRYLAEVDRGKKPAGERPVAPKAVKDAGLEFKWEHARTSPEQKAPRIPKDAFKKKT